MVFLAPLILAYLDERGSPGDRSRLSTLVILASVFMLSPKNYLFEHVSIQILLNPVILRVMVLWLAKALLNEAKTTGKYYGRLPRGRWTDSRHVVLIDCNSRLTTNKRTCRNSRARLKSAMLHALEFEDYEIIFVDDGSKDDFPTDSQRPSMTSILTFESFDFLATSAIRQRCKLEWMNAVATRLFSWMPICRIPPR